jgi:hypothetical protein
LSLTGRYDFKGFKKLSAVGLFTALGASPKLGFLTRGVGGKVVYGILGHLSNWLINNILKGLNITAEKVDVVIKKNEFDDGFELSITTADKEKAAGPLSPERAKEIDDEVRKVMRKFGRFTKSTTS